MKPKAKKRYPVIGVLHADPVGTFLRSPFKLFQTKWIEGLAIVPNPRHIEILAVMSRQRGRGHASRFLSKVMRHYDRVTIRFVTNRRLAAMLTRHKFDVDRTTSTYTWTRLPR
jgi:hypothetical protein